MQSQKEGNKGAFSALSARFKDIQRKIDATVELARDRALQKERDKKDETEKAKQNDAVKKAKPAPPVEPPVKEQAPAVEKPVEQKPVEKKPAEQAPVVEKPVAEKKPAPAAMASRALTGTHRVPCAWASPLTVLTPMRTPVKEPGPTTQAMRSSSATESPAACIAASIIGSRFTEWVILLTVAAS